MLANRSDVAAVEAGFQRRSLHEDRDAQFLLLGVPMVAISASLLWYVVGIGRSILWHDRAQEVADSAALTAAACQATGMNVVAFLNLVMLILTFFHVLLALLSWLLMWIAIILAWFPATDAVSALLWKAHDALDKADEKFVPVLEDLFPILGDTQKWVAIAAPDWAFEASAVNSLRYEDGGQRHYAITFSTSMIPLSTLLRLQKTGVYTPRPQKKDQQGNIIDPGENVPPGYTDVVGPDGSVTKMANKRPFVMPSDFEGREGLPVFADKFNSLCTNVLNLLGPDYFWQSYHDSTSKQNAGPGPLDNPIVSNAYGQLIKFITRLLRGAMCDDPFWNSGQYNGRVGVPYGAANGSTNPLTTDGQDDGNGDPACTPDGLRTMANSNAPPKPGPAPPQPGPQPDPQQDPTGYASWTAAKAAYDQWQAAKDAYDQFNSGKAVTARRTSQQKACKKAGKTYSKQEEDEAKAKNQDKGPKYMVNYALNANDWMQVWAWSWGDAPQDATDGRAIANISKFFKGKVSASDEQTPSNVYMAQAELYLDCHGRWFSVCNQFNLATFKMGWRGRLRRVEFPDLEEMASDVIEAAFADFMTSDWFRDVTRKLNINGFSLFNFQCKDAKTLSGCVGGTIATNLINIVFSLLKAEVLYEANLAGDHHTPMYQGSLH